MPTNNLAPKAKNKLGIASSIPPNMAERFGAAVSPYLQGAQALFPPTNPYGQVVSNFLLGQAPQAAQQMAAGYPNVLFNTSNLLGGNRIVNPAALDMLGALPVATAVKGAGMASGGVAATFAGARAKTANRAALALAEEMKALGTPDEEIYKATGWFFGSADGKPRFEIDDSGASLNASALRDFHNDASLVRQSRMMQHPELRAAYPDTGNIAYEKHNSPGASYTPESDVITMPQGAGHPDMSTEFRDTAVKSPMLHELQHAIQQREGFARGGSPEMAFRDPRMWGKAEAEGSDVARQMLKDKMREMATPMPIEDYAKQAWQSDTVTPEIATDYASYAKNIKKNAANFSNEAQKAVAQTWYKRLAGESEARLTQARMAMTGPERAASYPPDMYDVPVGDQIVRYGEGEAMSVPSMTEGELRHQTAQRNAALPVEQGGLGLAAGNTAAERAAAQGYPSQLGFGVSYALPPSPISNTSSFTKINGPRKKAEIIKAELEKMGVPVVGNTAKTGSTYLELPGQPYDVTAREGFSGGQTVPIEKIRFSTHSKRSDGIPTNAPDSEFLADVFPRGGNTLNDARTAIDALVKQGGIRSRDAAFDPFRRNAAIAAAMGVAAPNLLAGEQQSPESQAIARYREIKGPKSVVRMEAALRTAGVPLPKNEPVAYIQRLVDQAHRRN